MCKPVLVVDDEPQVRALLKTLLSREGLDSIEADDGSSAFTTAQRLHGEFSLLLTDINMPGSSMNGIELAGALRDHFPAIPVLFVSSAPISRTELSTAVPGSVLVEKPFDVDVFARTVRHLLS